MLQYSRTIVLYLHDLLPMSFRAICTLLFATGFLAACAPERPAGATRHAVDTAAAREAVLGVLEAQEQAWNRGDVEGFMEGYVRMDSLRFASGGRVQYGWQRTLEGYRRRYPDAAAMGTLTFDSLDVRLLGSDHALVFGHWQLRRTDDAPGGLFTLVFRHRPEGWRIVHDHTSSGS